MVFGQKQRKYGFLQNFSYMIPQKCGKLKVQSYVR